MKSRQKIIDSFESEPEEADYKIGDCKIKGFRMLKDEEAVKMGDYCLYKDVYYYREGDINLVDADLVCHSIGRLAKEKARFHYFRAVSSG